MSDITMQTCDQCGTFVRAVWFAVKGDFILFYCNHHIKQNEAMLNSKGWTIHMIFYDDLV